MATVVSCFYKIPSKHPFSNYTKWIENFMALEMRTIIYVNKESYAFLHLRYPETEMRQYVLKEFSEFITSEYDWKKDEAVDHELDRGHNSLLYMIWNEKPFFVQDAMNRNIYNTEFFMWVDIGCFRDSSLLSMFKGFPNPQKINKDKLQFLQVKPFEDAERANLENIDERFRYVNRIGGTMFTCPKSKVNTFAEIHKSLLSDFSLKKLFKGKDQSLFAFHVLQHPSLFELVIRPSDTPSKNDEWFYLQDYLSEYT